MSKFVESKSVITYAIKPTKDGRLSNSALVSVVPTAYESVRITVGAYYKDSCATLFGKKALAELIEELQAVHDVMK